MNKYLLRLAEQAVIAFLGGFAASLAVSGGLDKAALVGAVTAGARAVYGLVVKPVGDTEQPSAK